MTGIQRVFLSITITALLGHPVISIGTVDLSSLNWDRLNSGEVIVQTVENQDNVPGIRLFFIVAAPRATIWETLLDYQNFPQIFKGTKSVEVKKQDVFGAEVEIKYTNNIIGLFSATYTYVLRRDYKKPGELLTWHRKSGDFNVIEGSWQILQTDLQNSFLLIYESFLDGNWLFPAHLVRKIAIKEAVTMSQHLRHWIEYKER